MKNSIDHSVKNIIQTRLNFISLESVKNNTCLDQTTNKFEQKEIYIRPAQN
jgi:hypothetical protein